MLTFIYLLLQGNLNIMVLINLNCIKENIIKQILLGDPILCKVHQHKIKDICFDFKVFISHKSILHV